MVYSAQSLDSSRHSICKPTPPSPLTSPPPFTRTHSTSATSPRVSSSSLHTGLQSLLLVVAWCTIPTHACSAGETTPATEQSDQSPPPAALNVTPADGATDVPVVDGVSASVSGGEIT